MATPETSRVEIESDTKALSRGERRRIATHARLVAAARSVIADKGIDATTIQDITEAADLGFGTFYNHFDSKEAILDELIRDILDSFHEELDRITEPLQDPAEVVATVVANTLRLADVDPVLCGFMVRVGSVRKQLGDGVAWRMKRDVTQGTRQGRFQVPDVKAVRVAIGGALYVAISERLRGRLSPKSDRHVAHLVLRLLGLDDEEAAAIARRAIDSVAAG